MNSSLLESFFVGNESTRTKAEEYLFDSSPRNMILGGLKGLGKRTWAEAYCKEKNLPCILIQTTLSIDAIRTVSYLASLRQKGRIVVILDDADTAEEAAQHAFLKTLEEAPYLSFVLVAHNPDALLPTIRSRAPLFYFSPVSEDLLRLFVQRFDIMSSADQDFIAIYSAGRPGVATRIAESLESLRKWEVDLRHFFEHKDAARIQFFYSYLLPYFQEDPERLVDMCIIMLQRSAATHSADQVLIRRLLAFAALPRSSDRSVLQFVDIFCVA
ncbi:MAG: hypothetical protein KGI50_01955 [Patescibacteria group bacterium]|nr:hypothetical protein [Patescibacteria group bacterium]MDE2437891.1 hypothetical protein [Patescibacteria group bacterium]